MPPPKRSRRERTDEWESVRQWTLWPEQELYEQIRPIILYGQTPGERAKETGAAQRTLSRKADEFEKYGMQSLFDSDEQGGARETTKTLPEYIRQLIIDLHFELPTMSWREIAEICFIRYGRKPSHHSVKHIATSGPGPGRNTRRYQPWHEITDPAERKLAVIRLHSEGWSVTSIAEYLHLCRHFSCLRYSLLSPDCLEDTEKVLTKNATNLLICIATLFQTNGDIGNVCEAANSLGIDPGWSWVVALIVAEVFVIPRDAQRVLPQQQSGLRAFFIASLFREREGV